MRPVSAAYRKRKNHFFIAPAGFLGGSPATQRQKLKRGKKNFFIVSPPEPKLPVPAEATVLKV